MTVQVFVRPIIFREIVVDVLRELDFKQNNTTFLFFVHVDKSDFKRLTLKSSENIM